MLDNQPKAFILLEKAIPLGLIPSIRTIKGPHKTFHAIRYVSAYPDRVNVIPREAINADAIKPDKNGAKWYAGVKVDEIAQVIDFKEPAETGLVRCVIKTDGTVGAKKYTDTKKERGAKIKWARLRYMEKSLPTIRSKYEPLIGNANPTKKSFGVAMYCVDKFCMRIGGSAGNREDHFGCVDPEHKILMSDLTYKVAKDLKVDDEIITLEEENPKGIRRRFLKSKITYFEIIKKPKLEITLSDGTILRVSSDHPFLYPKEDGRTRTQGWKWKRADEFKEGDILNRVLPFWEVDNSYNAGYLSASFDGEGWISKPTTRGVRIGFAQNENIMWDEFKRLISKINISIVYRTEKKVKRIYTSGLEDVFMLLGSIRPKRLLDKFLCNFNLRIGQGLKGSKHDKNRTYIVKIKSIGEGDVVGLSTDVKTYICEGFLSHNTTTLQCKHISQDEDGTVHINFIGKSGVEWNVKVEDANVAKAILELKGNRNPEDKLLYDVDRTDVVKWLGRFRVTAKDFRTYHASNNFIEFAKQYITPTKRKEQNALLKNIYALVASKLHNTPSVCKAKYVLPSLVEHWLSGGKF
jgi:DNA topoisomerase IB